MNNVTMTSDTLAVKSMYGLITTQLDYINHNYSDEDDEYLNSNYSTVHDFYMSQIPTGSATFGILLAVWTLVINSVIVACCLRDKETRSDAFYSQIINLCVSNILTAILVLPLTVYHLVHIWDLGHITCKVFIISDVLLPFVSIIIILIMNVDRILLTRCANVYKCIFQKSLTQLVIITPWLVAGIIVVPLWTSTTNMSAQCMVSVSLEVQLMSTVLTYFLPISFLIMFTLKVIILHFVYHARLSTNSHNELQELSVGRTDMTSEHTDDNDVTNEKRPAQVNRCKSSTSDSVMAVCLVSLIFDSFLFPYQCLNIILCTSQLCIPPLELVQVVTWLGASSAGVARLCLFFDRKLRKNFRLSVYSRSSVPVVAVAEQSSRSCEETYL